MAASASIASASEDADNHNSAIDEDSSLNGVDSISSNLNSANTINNNLNIAYSSTNIELEPVLGRIFSQMQTVPL